MKLFGVVITIFCFIIESNVFAFDLTGTVYDSITIKPLPSVSIELSSLENKSLSGAISNSKGFFKIGNIENGNYLVKISYVGYHKIEKNIKIDNKDLNIGKIFLSEKPTVTGEVQVEAKMPSVELQGDTTQFNAGAYKANPDANAEDLVQKMPGIVVQDNKVQAQGEEVKKVLMDGKPFFGDDPTAALKNLPAEIIDKVQIYDQKSEQSQFTGFDDGSTTKTMNIITHANMRTGQFGKAYAGYGTDDKYQAGTNFNIFGEERRTSILTQTNNINQQNFAIDDILGAVSGSSGRRQPFFGMGSGRPPGGGMPGGRGGRRFSGGGDVGDFLVGQQNGISTSTAFGINYTDKWNEDIKVTGSYFINKSDNDALQNILREYITNSDTNQTYRENNNSNSSNWNHRFNFKFDYDIDSSNSILIRPRITVQQNDGNSGIDANTYLKTKILNRSDNLSNSNLSGYNISNELLWRHKFDTKGRTFSVSGNTGINKNDGSNSLNANSIYFTQNFPSFDTLNQNSDLRINGTNLSYNLAYTEPIFDNSQLMFNYNGSYVENKSDKKTNNFSDITNSYSELDKLLSNVFTSDYYTQSLGTNYMFNNDESNFNAGVSYQKSILKNNSEFPDKLKTERIFNNLLPSARFSYKFSRQKNFRIFYRTSTDLPSVNQLQNVINNSNPLQLSIGNPKLQESYEHSLFANFMSVDMANASNFFIMGGFRYSNSYIGNSTTQFNKDSVLVNGTSVIEGTQLSEPVNLENYLNLRSFINYGFPFDFIKSNININAGLTYSKIPGLLNNQKNYSNNESMTLGLVLSSNISPDFDFTISSFSNLNFAENTIRTDQITEFFSQNTRFKLNLTLWERLILRSDLEHQLNSGLSSDYNQSYLLWNANIGIKLFDKKQGEINLSAFDLLNQNNNISRSVNDIYLQDTQSNVLQRYLMLSFIYTFKNYGVPDSGN